MTRNRARKQRARALSAATGLPYTQALRTLTSPRQASRVALPREVRWTGQSTAANEFFLGADDVGGDVTVDLTRAGHALVCGATGAGKSATMHCVALQALKKGWQVAICDPGQVTWAGWSHRVRPGGESPGPRAVGEGRPGVVEHATDLAGTRDVLARAVLEVERRMRARQTEPRTPLLVVVDELGHLDSFPHDLEAQIRREALSSLEWLVICGRGVDVHVLGGALAPWGAGVRAVRLNAGARVLCGATTEVAQRSLFGGDAWPDLPASVNGVEVRGHALVRTESTLPIRSVQLAWLGGSALEALDAVAPLPARL